MKTGYIKIIGESVSQPNIEIDFANGTIWMDINEISDLFQVETCIVNKNITSLFKSNQLRQSDVTYEHRYTNENGIYCIKIYYNLDVIVFLCFRVMSLQAEMFRCWITQNLCQSNQNGLLQTIPNTELNGWTLAILN